MRTIAHMGIRKKTTGEGQRMRSVPTQTMENVNESLAKQHALTCRDLSDYAYCPRRPYWIHVRKAKLPSTKKMQLGKQYHSSYLSRARPSSKTITDIHLIHDELNLSGIIDLLEFKSSEIILHEIKFTTPPRRIPPDHYLQLLGQAVLVEHNFHQKINKVLITYPRGKNHAVFLPAYKEQILLPILRAIREIIHHEQLLPPTSAFQKCFDCEFYKLCKRA